MSRTPTKVGVTGTHSTGKTTFLDSLEQELAPFKLRVSRLGEMARGARSLGFPILKDHTFESTLWIIGECLRREAEASLSSDVILVDRPVIDALGYLQAALRLSDRTIGERRLDELITIVKAHTPDYDLLIRTSLDPSIALGVGRDQDIEFRGAAASSIEALVSEIAPNAFILTSSNQQEVVQKVVDFVGSRLPTSINR